MTAFRSWQGTLFVPVSLRKGWFIFRQKNLIVVLPRLFTHLRAEKPEKCLTYVEDSDYDKSGSQIPVFDECY